MSRLATVLTKMELDIADLAVVREELDTLDKLISEEVTKSRRLQQSAESCEAEEAALRKQLPAILGRIGFLECSMDDSKQVLRGFQACCQEQQEKHALCEAAGNKAMQDVVNELESFVAQCDEFAADYDHKILMVKTGKQLSDVELCRVRIAQLEAAVQDWRQKIAAADQAAHVSKEDIARIQEEYAGAELTMSEQKHKREQLLQHRSALSTVAGSKESLAALGQQVARLNEQEMGCRQRLQALALEEAAAQAGLDELRQVTARKEGEVARWKLAFEALSSPGRRQPQAETGPAATSGKRRDLCKPPEQAREPSDLHAASVNTQAADLGGGGRAAREAAAPPILARTETQVLEPVGGGRGPLVTVAEGAAGDPAEQKGPLAAVCTVVEPDSPPSSSRHAADRRPDLQRQQFYEGCHTQSPEGIGGPHWPAQGTCIYTETTITRKETPFKPGSQESITRWQVRSYPDPAWHSRSHGDASGPLQLQAGTGWPLEAWASEQTPATRAAAATSAVRPRQQGGDIMCSENSIKPSSGFACSAQEQHRRPDQLYPGFQSASAVVAGLAQDRQHKYGKPSVQSLSSRQPAVDQQSSCHNTREWPCTTAALRGTHTAANMQHRVQQHSLPSASRQHAYAAVRNQQATDQQERQMAAQCSSQPYQPDNQANLRQPVQSQPNRLPQNVGAQQGNLQTMRAGEMQVSRSAAGMQPLRSDQHQAPLCWPLRQDRQENLAGSQVQEYLGNVDKPQLQNGRPSALPARVPGLATASGRSGAAARVTRPRPPRRQFKRAYGPDSGYDLDVDVDINKQESQQECPKPGKPRPKAARKAAQTEAEVAADMWGGVRH